MTVITGWDLFGDHHAAQDELQRAAGGRSWRPGQQYEGSPGAPVWSPTVDISERKDAYLVTAELPGVTASEVEITFEAGLLTVQGERHFAHDSGEEKMHRTERLYGPFRRSISLPSHVEADNIEATAQDGVLQIMVPKAPEVQARRIHVRTGQERGAEPGTVVSDGS